MDKNKDKVKRKSTRARAALLPSANGDGVFPSLVDRKAFFDKLVFSIQGTKRDPIGGAVRNLVNRPIGGSARKYARSETGVLAATGNSYDLKYGRMKKFFPPIVLTLRSDGTPLSLPNTVAAINSLCEDGWSAVPSEVELTFDLSGRSVEFFKRSSLTSARRSKTLPDDERRPPRTYYVGGRKSPWQLRVYDKTPSLVRVEFIARRAFLGEHGIQTPARLRLLRDIDLRPRVRLRELDKGQMKALEESIDQDYRRRVLARWVRDLSLLDLLPALKKKFAAVPEELVVPSPVEERLRLMQWQLIWGR